MVEAELLSTLQSISYIAGATGVCIAAIYYVLNLRTSLQTRQAQLFMNVFQNTYSQFYQDAQYKTYDIKLDNIDDYIKMRSNEAQYKAFYTYATFFEGIGVLVRERLVDVRLVSMLMSGMITRWWNNYENHVILVRKERNFPRYMVEVEYLVKRILDYGREHPELGIVAQK